jgi:hypothetical protein
MNLAPPSTPISINAWQPSPIARSCYPIWEGVPSCRSAIVASQNGRCNLLNHADA